MPAADHSAGAIARRLKSIIGFGP